MLITGNIKNHRVNSIIESGLERSGTLKIAVCSIVRDCEKNLRNNIPIVNNIVSKFQDFRIIVFENDSIDGTKNLLKVWANHSSKIFVQCETFGTRTIPEKSSSHTNKYFSRYRITKMINYRNRYLDKLEEINFKPDYVLIVDLDVSKIFINGVFHSIGLNNYWDVITANGFSLSPRLKRRYHDSYALVENGSEALSQTENSMRKISEKFGSISKNMPLIPVYSAYGGLAIYRYDAIRKLRYRLIENKDNRVEVRCEHYSICHDIRKNGFNRIFVNPAMRLRYQSLTYDLLKKFLKRGLKLIIGRND